MKNQFRLQQVNSRALPAFGDIQPLLVRDIAEVIKVLWGEEVGGQIAGIFRHTLETGERYLAPPCTARREDLDVEESYEREAPRVTWPDGRHAVVCYFADISERRALEISKAERAADLVRADRGKDEFPAMFAHELRNPLAPLRSATEILRTPGATAEATALAVGLGWSKEYAPTPSWTVARSSFHVSPWVKMSCERHSATNPPSAS